MFRRRRHPGLNRRVLVSLFSGNAVAGVMVDDRGQFILKGCQVFEAGVEAGAQVDGEIVIDRANVDYVQIVDA